jgi:phage terminase large subunit
MRDFLMIMQEHHYFKDVCWSKTEFTYIFETGSKIEFFSVDQPEKVRGARRDKLFINEANNVSFDAFEQLEVRTKDFIFIDFNPTSEFWVFTDILGVRDDIDHITLNYLDNEALSQEIINSIESRKNRKDWWQVYGSGLLGELTGKIYKDWKIIDEVPHEARLERYGLNFGYTNHPTGIVKIYYHNGGYILDELAYRTGMLNRVIADTIDSDGGDALTIADSAEPKSIDEIKEHGINILPAEKGKDSVCNGIQLVQGQRISVTKRSINIIKEQRNYLWKVDRNGKVLNVPEEPFHYIMDAIRYGMSDIVRDMPIDEAEEIRQIAENRARRKRQELL